MSTVAVTHSSASLPKPNNVADDSARPLHGEPASTNDPSHSGQHAANNPGAGIDYGLFLDCVHCGLCTAACPTYVELGNENDGPRGRIYLMRSVTDGRLELNHEVRRHLELCLDCRACETACPSGVQYGKLIEPFRVAMEQMGDGPKKNQDWFHRWILFGIFPYPDRMRKALIPARVAQRLGLTALIENLGLLRKLALSLLKRESSKRSLKCKRVLAAINTDYLETVIRNGDTLGKI